MSKRTINVHEKPVDDLYDIIDVQDQQNNGDMNALFKVYNAHIPHKVNRMRCNTPVDEITITKEITYAPSSKSKK